MTAELATPPLMTSPIQSSMSLSRRQRAMLKEMGVQVWQPLPVVPAAPVKSPVQSPVTINSGAARAHITTATATFDSQKQPFLTTKSSLEAEAPPLAPHSANNAWRIGRLQTLYPDAATTQTGRWLVLIESPASALQDNFNPFEGDAGKLLDNMLRAAKLHTAVALLAPLVRGQGAALNAGFSAELADTFANAQANVVLVMGRIAAQALLESTEPLAKLRGRVQTLHNTPTVITLEPAYLLRNPLDKAKAWDDLCLAISVAKA